MLIPTQLGGGLRDIETIQKILTLGIERVILGTVAVENPELVEEACKRFNDYIIISIDARDGFVATHGWMKETSLTTVQFAAEHGQAGSQTVYLHRYCPRRHTDRTQFYRYLRIGAQHEITGHRRRWDYIDSAPQDAETTRRGRRDFGKALYTGDIKLKEALAEINK